MFTVLTLPWGSWPTLLAAITQATATLDARAADVMQYLFGLGIVAILALVYRIDHRLARVEGKLDDPDRGVIAELKVTRRFRHVMRNRVFAHGFRLRTLEQNAGLPVVEDTEEDIPELGGTS